MKKFILVILGLYLSFQVCYSQLQVKVDERFELVGITFSLAGVPEFCDTAIPSYRHDIIEDLDKLYTLTEPIHFVRKLNREYAIGYNAASTAASMLEIKDDSILLNPKYRISQITEFDSRWTPELFEEYIEMLNVFYKQSDFHNWFEDHRPLYDLAEKRFNEHIANTATEWFQSFFGTEIDPDIMFYISLVNGPHNYAMPDGILLGVCSDEEGQPAPDKSTMSLLIHEIGHHYTNPLCDKYWEQMKPAADKIFPYVEEQMAEIAYGSAKTTTIEWLNDLFVIMYMKENGEYLQYNISYNVVRGFIWMQRSVDFMDNFYANRDIYPTIEEFMPQLVGFLNFTADHFDSVKREFDQRAPYITSIYPAPGSDITNITEIEITFSEKMNGSYGFMGWPEGTEVLPFESVKWSDDNMKAILILTPNQIKKGKSYGIKLSERGFQSVKHFSLDQKYTDIIFNKGISK